MTYVPSLALGEEDDGIPPGAEATVQPDGEWSDFLPHQFDAYDWDPADRLGVLAFLGGWGAAKTTGAARIFVKGAQENPHTPAYGNGNPIGIVIAPTFKILRQATLPALEQLLPRELVHKRRGPPHSDILLTNGFRILLHSGEASLEGVTACVCWIDEIAHSTFASNPQRYLNYMARLRDPNSPRMRMIVSGLPESGWVRDTFDKSGPNQKTILVPTKANPFIPAETLKMFFDACPSGQEETLLGGAWRAPTGAVYPQFSSELHIVDRGARDGETTHLAFDVGNFGAILFGQEIPVDVKDVTGAKSKDKGLLIVDQILTTDLSVEAQAHMAKSRGHQIRPGKSIIAVDPTIRRDELEAIRRCFPGVTVRKHERGDEEFPIETGIRYVQRALRDANLNTRLFFTRKIANEPKGIIDGVQRYRRREHNGEAIKDNLRDHVLDALRYLVCETIPPMKPMARVF